MKDIVVQGLNQNNLKHVSFRIPKEKIKMCIRDSYRRVLQTAQWPGYGGAAGKTCVPGKQPGII